MPEGEGPYSVQQVITASGPCWRLAGPGLEDARAYPGEDFRDKLSELALLMNFAWEQALLRATPASVPRGK